MSIELPQMKTETSGDKPARNELNPAGGRIRSLQHLRFIAASVIVLYHAELQLTRLTDGQHLHSLSFGAAGTDLFFAIGGFILVYTQFDRKERFGTFLYRRMMRIAPLYWLFTFLMLLALLVAPSHLLTTKVELPHFLFSLAFIPYPHPVLGVDRPFLFPGWVLNHFVFFYVLFGALLFLSTGRRVLVASALLCALIVLKFLLPGESRILDFYGATVGLDFVLGMMVGWLFLERRVSPVLIVLVALIGLSVFAAGVVEDVSDGSERAFFWGVAGSSLLFVCVFVEKQWGWPDLRWVRKMGDMSYSVFVSHLFALAAVASIARAIRLLPIAGIWGARIIFLGAAWGLGYCVYTAIEGPLLRHLGRERKQRSARPDELVLVKAPPDAPISPGAALS
jgi:exopolysaccharide production protein ExoZ